MNIDETNCNSEFFNNDLDVYNNLGLIAVVNKSCKSIITRDMLNKKFTILILFKPDVQRTISSLSFSNFKIVNMVAKRKEKGINFVTTFDNARKEYKK